MMAEERRLLGDGLVSSRNPPIRTLVEAERSMRANGSDKRTHALVSSPQGSPVSALLLDPSIHHLFACSGTTMTGPPESLTIRWQPCSHPTPHRTRCRDRQYQPFTWSWLGGRLHGWMALGAVRVLLWVGGWAGPILWRIITADSLLARHCLAA